MTDLTADEVIALLGLAPHPEGGCFRETFRDCASSEGRGASTAIYFLLRAGEISRWHRVDAAEVWLWHAGAPLVLSISEAGGTVRQVLLGSDLRTGQRPQAVVQAHHWQQALSTGAWTLVSCTVAPAFMFETFELAPPDFRPDGAALQSEP